jgi:hypothetical protein
VAWCVQLVISEISDAAALALTAVKLYAEYISKTKSKARAAALLLCGSLVLLGTQPVFAQCATTSELTACPLDHARTHLRIPAPWTFGPR